MSKKQEIREYILEFSLKNLISKIKYSPFSKKKIDISDKVYPEEYSTLYFYQYLEVLRSIRDKSEWYLKNKNKIKQILPNYTKLFGKIDLKDYDETDVKNNWFIYKRKNPNKAKKVISNFDTWVKKEGRFPF